jgi:7-cyano-7-deazaguanine tRNA-ribosyltransferase
MDMIMTAKMNLPPDRPLHLFGAGHPFMFSLAVALGCDLFDSAAYALYAKEDRYMTETGTARLNELEYFPCTCPKCTKTTPKQVIELSAKEKEAFLAEHNLYVCAAEIRRIKQAIKDGRLWELVQQRVHSHPALYTAFRKLKQYEDFIEKHSPAVKNSGLFYFSHNDLVRPEIVHYRRTLKERYTKPKQAKTLLLFPQTRSKPFSKSTEYKQIRKALRKHADTVHTCFYAAPFGVIPIELDEVYPLSQHETATPPDSETIQYVASQVADYINRTDYRKVILLNDSQNWSNAIQSTARRVCKQKNMTIKLLSNTRDLQIALKSSI